MQILHAKHMMLYHTLNYLTEYKPIELASFRPATNKIKIVLGQNISDNISNI